MEYLITAMRKDGTREILSRHTDKEEALEAGRQAFLKAEKGALISCISGTLDENGNTIGKYLFYDSWF